MGTTTATYLDTRDLAAELEELERREEEAHDLRTRPEDFSPEELAELPTLELDEDEAVRLAELRDLASEIGSEFRHGETMIPVDQFEDYARELAEDIGAIKGDEGWPMRHIDWEAAAKGLAQDYTEVEWEGVSYYVRMN